jgi:hypothetical protein
VKWHNTDLLGFKNKLILRGDVNTKHRVPNSKVSNPSGLKLLELFVSYSIEMSAPQCPKHYTPDGRGDVLNIRTSDSQKLLLLTF